MLYDGTEWVRRSQDVGEGGKFILVTANYRVGIFGALNLVLTFFASRF